MRGIILNIGISQYKWEYGYGGTDPLDEYFFHNKPLLAVFRTGYPAEDLSGRLANQFLERNPPNYAGKILALMNAKYILLHRDFNPFFMSSDFNPSFNFTSLERLKITIDSLEGFHLENSFGELDFYRNEYWRSLQLYATPNAVLVQGGLDELMKTVQKDDFTLGESVLLLSDQLSPTQLKSLSTGLFSSSSTGNVSLTYEKVDPTKYIVHVNASQPFFLVFSESYHKDWVAHVNGEQVPDDQQFMANGYANAWHVKKTGSFDVVLEFWPQRLFYIGATVSFATFIFCVLYLSKDRMKAFYSRCIKKRKYST